MRVIYSIITLGIWIGIVLLSAIFLKRIFPNQSELSRKAVHIGTGPIIPLAWYLDLPQQVGIAISSIVTIMLIINYKINLLPEIEAIQRRSLGTVAYGISITFLFITLWPSNPAAVTAGVLAMAFGDGFAGLLGSKIKSPSWQILGERKSIVGTITMLIVVALTLIFISLFNGIPIQTNIIIVLTLLTVGLEQIGPWGIDNLTVPILTAFGWHWLVCN